MIVRGLFALTRGEDDESDTANDVYVVFAHLVAKLSEIAAVRDEVQALHKTINRALRSR